MTSIAPIVRRDSADGADGSTLMDMQWYCRVDGQELGPLDAAALSELREAGTIGDETDVRRDGINEWRHLRDALPEISADPVVQPGAESSQAGDDEFHWFYRLAGQDLGPLTFRELTDLATQGVLTADDEVKCGAQGRYRRAGSIGRLMAALPYRAPEKIQRAWSAPSLPTPESSNPKAAESPPAVPTAVATTVQYQPAAMQPIWFAWIRGVEYGPVSLLQLAQLISAGQITAYDFVRYGPMGGWLPPHPTVEQALAQLAFTAPVQQPAPAMSSPQAPTSGATVAVSSTAPAASALAPNVPAVTASATSTVTPSVAAKPTAAAKPEPSPKPELTRASTASVPPSIESPRVGTATNQNPANATPVVAATPRTPTPKSPVDTPSKAPDKLRETTAASPPTKPPNAAALPTKSEPAAAKIEPAAAAQSAVPVPTPHGQAVVSAAAPPAIAVTKPVASSIPQPRSSATATGPSFLSQLSEKTSAVMGLAGVLVVAALLGLFFVLPSGAGDRDKLDQLQQILAEFRRHRDDGAQANEWNSFTAQAEQSMAQIAKDLEPKATRDYPARQNLLWAARDRMPEMLKNAREKPTSSENDAEMHLKQAAFHLGLGPDPGATP